MFGMPSTTMAAAKEKIETKKKAKESKLENLH
jgi:hypothetical protein